MRYVLILVLGLLAGCNLPWEREKYDRTPNGWHVQWKESGTQLTGLHTKLELLELFDAAMVRSFSELSKWGIDANTARGKVRDYDPLFTCYDNFYFKVPDPSAVVDFPGAAYASGETFNRFEIWVAFYNKAAASPDVPANVPPSAPSWTLKDSTSFPGKVYWGEERPGEQYPALGYELHWLFTNAP